MPPRGMNSKKMLKKLSKKKNLQECSQEGSLSRPWIVCRTRRVNGSEEACSPFSPINGVRSLEGIAVTRLVNLCLDDNRVDSSKVRSGWLEEH